MCYFTDPILFLLYTVSALQVQRGELYILDISHQPPQFMLISGPEFSPLFVRCLYQSSHFTNIQTWPKLTFVEVLHPLRKQQLPCFKRITSTLRQVALYPGPTLKTEQQVFDSCRTPQLTTSLAYCFLPLNLIPDPVFDFF